MRPSWTENPTAALLIVVLGLPGIVFAGDERLDHVVAQRLAQRFEHLPLLLVGGPVWISAGRAKQAGWRRRLRRVSEGALDALGTFDEGGVRESKETEPVLSKHPLGRRCYTGQPAFWKGNRVIGSRADGKRTWKLRRSLTACG